MVNVWSHVANVLVPAVHPNGIPLVGPGIWERDFRKWRLIASRLDGLSAAAVHCYPDTGNIAVDELSYLLSQYRAVRSDLPLICTEWTARGKRVLGIRRAIASKTEAHIWYGPGTPGHELEGTPEYGILALSQQ